MRSNAQPRSHGIHVIENFCCSGRPAVDFDQPRATPRYYEEPNKRRAHLAWSRLYRGRSRRMRHGFHQSAYDGGPSGCVPKGLLSVALGALRQRCRVRDRRAAPVQPVRTARTHDACRGHCEHPRLPYNNDAARDLSGIGRHRTLDCGRALGAPLPRAASHRTNASSTSVARVAIDCALSRHPSRQNPDLKKEARDIGPELVRPTGIERAGGRTGPSVWCPSVGVST